MSAEDLPDPRIKLAMDWLLLYQNTLRKTFLALPRESQMALLRDQNPELATGPMDIFVCTNGVVATINNGLVASAEIPANVMVPKVLSSTMVEHYNASVDRIFLFTEPISKLVTKGFTAKLTEDPKYETCLLNLIIADDRNRNWYPPASKVFLIGWKYFEYCDPQQSAIDAAKEALRLAYTSSNLRSGGAAKKLLQEYRSLLANATREAELQTFLEAHPEFVYPEHDTVLAKPSLAGERVPDFAFSMRSSSGVQWVFVEIERSSKRIFTLGEEFQFTSDFTQAKGQLLSWDSLIRKGLGYFEKCFPGLEQPAFHLVFGRDNELTPKRREMLLAEFANTPNRKFSTFDDLANRFETIITRIFPNESIRKT